MSLKQAQSAQEVVCVALSKKKCARCFFLTYSGEICLSHTTFPTLCTSTRHSACTEQLVNQGAESGEDIWSQGGSFSLLLRGASR